MHNLTKLNHHLHNNISVQSSNHWHIYAPLTQHSSKPVKNPLYDKANCSIRLKQNIHASTYLCISSIYASIKITCRSQLNRNKTTHVATITYLCSNNCDKTGMIEASWPTEEKVVDPNNFCTSLFSMSIFGHFPRNILQ